MCSPLESLKGWKQYLMELFAKWHHHVSVKALITCNFMNHSGVLSTDVAHHILCLRFCCLKIQICKETGLFNGLMQQVTASPLGFSYLTSNTGITVFGLVMIHKWKAFVAETLALTHLNLVDVLMSERRGYFRCFKSCFLAFTKVQFWSQSVESFCTVASFLLPSSMKNCELWERREFNYSYFS